jgi:hypothetical protein
MALVVRAFVGVSIMLSALMVGSELCSYLRPDRAV